MSEEYYTGIGIKKWRFFLIKKPSSDRLKRVKLFADNL